MFLVVQDTGALRGNLHKHRENMQSPHKDPTKGLNPGPCCCEARALTALPPPRQPKPLPKHKLFFLQLNELHWSRKNTNIYYIHNSAAVSLRSEMESPNMLDIGPVEWSLLKLFVPYWYPVKYLISVFVAVIRIHLINECCAESCICLLASSLLIRETSSGFLDYYLPKKSWLATHASSNYTIVLAHMLSGLLPLLSHCCDTTVMLMYKPLMWNPK